MDLPSSADEAKRRAFLGTGLVFGGRILGRLAYFATSVVLARSLGPHGFGLYALGWSVFVLFVLVAPLGLTQAIVRFAEVQRQAGTWRAFAVRVVLMGTVSSSILALAMAMSASTLAVHVFGDPELTGVIVAFAPAIWLRTLQTLLLAVVRTTGDVRPSVLIGDIGEPILTFLLVCITTLVGFGLLWNAAMYSVSLAVTVPLAFRAARQRLSGVAWPATASSFPLRQILRYGLVVMLAHSATVINMSADRVMLGIFADPMAAGLYQAASQLSLFTVMVLSSAATVFEIDAARFGALGRGGDLRELYHDVNRWSAHLLVPLSVLLLVAPRTILSATFGPAFVESALSLFILSVGQLAVVASGQASVLLTMVGRERIWLGVIGSAVMVNIVCSWLLIPSFGAAGAAAGTTIAAIGQSVAAILFVYARSRFWPADRSTALRIAASGILAAAGCLALGRAISTGWTLTDTVLLTIASFSIYAGAIWALGLHASDRKILTTLVHQARRRVVS